MMQRIELPQRSWQDCVSDAYHLRHLEIGMELYENSKDKYQIASRRIVQHRMSLKGGFDSNTA